jgi:hypothetical protein
MPVHKDLPQEELHNPKGFDPAANETVPIKTAMGLLEWVSIAIFGSTWLTGNGVPGPTLGKTGDFYLDADFGDFYEKTAFNTWTLKGNLDGSDWFNGAGAPASSIGRPKDFYVDVVDGDVYEKVDDTTWNLITNIDGSDWFHGTGAPSGSLGRVQDFYIDTVTGDLYEKTDPSTWTKFVNIDGSEWFSGAGVPSPSFAYEKDIYIDTTTGDLYKKTSPTVWTIIANIIGPVGPPGPGVSNDPNPSLAGDLNGDGHLIFNIGTINGVSITAHAARHLPDGDDPLATGVPSTVGTANATGTANALARQDHVHAHGNQAGGSLHANVIASGASGFMTGGDKTKLDGIPVNTQAQIDANTALINSHASRHLPNGADALATGVPSTVGTSNQAGTANALARQDHIHAHGNQAGGSLHADVVAAGASGFMSGSDKTKLDGIPANTQAQIDGNTALINAHASRHLPNGADALATGVPSTVGTTNQTGTANAFARQDHIHSHGDQAGGSLHAVATQSVPGFMSAADKTNLDKIVPFGQEREDFATNSTSSTSSTSFQNYATYNTQSKPIGRYRIGFTYIWRHDTIFTDVEIRVQIDGVDLLIPHREAASAGGTTQRVHTSGFSYVNFASQATHTITIDMRSPTSGDVTQLFGARAEIWRVS